jgi:hypothetical protein
MPGIQQTVAEAVREKRFAAAKTGKIQEYLAFTIPPLL